jgi:hypothetical protein
MSDTLETMSPAPVEEEKKKKRNPKAFWLGFLIAFLSAWVLAFTIALIEYYALGAGPLAPRLLQLFEDGVGLSGLLSFFVFLLSFAASKGAFDMLSYSLQVFFNTIFRPHYREKGFPKTFYDYKVLKDGEQRKPLLALFAVSMLFIIAGFILMMVDLGASH